MRRRAGDDAIMLVVCSPHPLRSTGARLARAGRAACLALVCTARYIAHGGRRSDHESGARPPGGDGVSEVSQGPMSVARRPPWPWLRADRVLARAIGPARRCGPAARSRRPPSSPRSCGARWAKPGASRPTCSWWARPAQAASPSATSYTRRSGARRSLRTIVVTTDVEIALVAAFGDGAGIVVSAGTGSIAVARDRRGRCTPGRVRLADGRRGERLAIGGRRSARRAARATAGAPPPPGGADARGVPLRDFDALVRWAAVATPGGGGVARAARARGGRRRGCRGSGHRGLRRARAVAAGAPPGGAAARSGPTPVALTGGLLETIPTLRRAVLPSLPTSHRSDRSASPSTRCSGRSRWPPPAVIAAGGVDRGVPHVYGRPSQESGCRPTRETRPSPTPSSCPSPQCSC